MKKNNPLTDPPNWAIRFLEWFCPSELTEGILGDLFEQFDADNNEYSIAKANRRFIWNVFRLFHPSIIFRNHLTINFFNMGIIKNYFKIALRSFWRQKLTTSINIIGLTLGIACASLTYVFVQHEVSFDKFHEESENIYWMTTTFRGDMNLMSTPNPLATELVDNIPEITEGLRLRSQDVMVEMGNEIFKESITFVDKNFFTFFNFDLTKGTKNSVFSKLKGLVISEKMAVKYFGRSNPIGQKMTLHFNETKDDFLITGVAQNAPDNSTVQFSFLSPMTYAYKDKMEELTTDWNKFGMTTFFRVKAKNDFETAKEKIKSLADTKYDLIDTEAGKQSTYEFIAHPFDEFHLGNGFARNGFIAPIDKTYVKILGLIGLLILMVACLNFMNLSNAKSSKRLTEVGVRKVLGARPQQLRQQFLTEAILVSFCSLFLGIFLIEMILPLIQQILSYHLTINWLEPKVLLPLVGITLLTGILAGIYPSILLARLKAVSIFKSKLKIGGNNWATKGSLIFQFALSVGLLSCALIMFQQQQFVKNKNLGFNQEEIIVIPTQVRYGDKTDSKRIVQQFKQELRPIAEVKEVSSVSHSFNRGNQVQFIQGEFGQMELIVEYRVDTNYLSILDIQLLSGHNFVEESAEKKVRSVIVNEAFLKKYKVEEVTGYRLPENFNDFSDAEIIGVVKDYHFANLKEVIKPLMLHTSNTSKFGNILVKIDPKNIDKTIAQLKTSWQKVRPEKSFEFSFLDEDIQNQYIAEERWSKVISGATLLAILISCLGLFGLIALTLAERTKEIGVRKILGASALNITWLVSRQFVVLLLIASIIAIPVAIYGMQNWLKNFAYQIDIQWFVFFVAVGLTGILAMLTTVVQSLRAALQNPVHALQQE